MSCNCSGCGQPERLCRCPKGKGETPSPMFIDNFNPDDKAVPRQTVYDFANNKAYVFNPEGEYRTFQLTDPNASVEESK